MWSEKHPEKQNCLPLLYIRTTLMHHKSETKFVFIGTISDSSFNWLANNFEVTGSFSSCARVTVLPTPFSQLAFKIYVALH